MKIYRIGLTAASLFLFAASLSALPTHTWVSANGNDANAGTALSPYADFATAVANTAAGGIGSDSGEPDDSSMGMRSCHIVWDTHSSAR